jgi:cleavage and polyadenylation specificity factor subunit 2
VSQLGNYEIAYISGVLTQGSADSVFPKLLPASEADALKHDPILIGDVKFSEFKKVLQDSGLQVEFQAGDLVCNQLVSVRKLETGEMILEGPLCPEYFKIRSLMYDQLAIL